MKRTIWLPKMHRTIERDVRANDETLGDGRKTWRTVISTEREVERFDWWTGKRWIEVLGHNKAEIDLERAMIGLPALESHDPGQHVGIGKGARIEKKQLVVDTTFSRRQAGIDLERDVEDGIKGPTSVGYVPRTMKLVETRDEDVDVYRVTRWTPFEYSFVAMPADIDSSVDRSSGAVQLFPVEVEIEDDAERVAEEAAMFRGLFADPSLPRGRSEEPPDRPRGADPTPAPASPAQVGPSARDVETKKIAEIATQYKMADRLADWIGRDLSLAEVRDEAMKILEARAEKALSQPAAELVKLTKKEASEYSIFRAMQAAANPATRGVVGGLEGDVSQEIAKAAARDGVKTHGGFFVPTLIHDDPESRSRALEQYRRRQLSKRIMTSIGAGVGADMVFDQPGELIDLLRETMVLVAAGANVLNGLVGPVPFPKKTTALTAFVMGEAPASGVAESTLGTDLVTLAAKTRMAKTRLTRQFLNQQAYIGEAMIRDELAYAHAFLNDNEGLNGDGTAGHSLGIFNIPGVVNDGDATGTGGVAEFKNFTTLAARVRKANALAPGFSWITTPENAGVCMTIPEIAAAGANRLWQGSFDDGRVAGYPARVSNLIPTNLGTGTDGHGVLGGAFGEMIIGFWGAIEIVVNPYTEDDKGIIAFTSYQEADSIVRHPEAFRYFNADLS